MAPTADDFRARLRAAWARSDAIFSWIAPEALLDRPIALRHPFVFYLGHLPAFAWNQIAKGVLGRGALDAGFDVLFERGIDPADETAAATTVRAAWPERAAIERYRDRVREAILAAVDGVLAIGASDVLAERGRVLSLVLEHEWMHHETLLYMVQALRHDRKRPPPGWDATLAPSPIEGSSAPRPISPGRVVLGARFEEVDFGWDNEFPETPVDVAAFEIDAVPVRNAAFARFVDAGGYARRELWDAEGWAWRERAGMAAPIGWSGEGVKRRVRALFADVPWAKARDWPASVSYAEATAFARFVGRRLPTEPEVRRAAAAFDVAGNGWEWTSTPFAPFPGFTAWARTYPGYSADFFDGRHRVLLGHSFATEPALRRPSFRNWFQPHYPYVFSKFRTVRET